MYKIGLKSNIYIIEKFKAIMGIHRILTFINNGIESIYFKIHVIIFHINN